MRLSVFVFVVGGFRGNVQGGRGGDNCNGYGVFTDEFMGAIRVGSVRLKPSLNDTKVQVPTGFAAVRKRARTRPPVAPRAPETGNILFHRTGEFVTAVAVDLVMHFCNDSTAPMRCLHHQRRRLS